jgi:putative component of toxin-antitoxin plasmid stabilization module
MQVEKTDEYRDWIDSLKDQTARARVSELKVDVGPGYRVYYSQRGNRLLLLIAGGDKSTQAKDISKALELNRSFVE